MKHVLILIFCFAASFSFGQVSGVDYLMKYNCETNQYDVKLVVLSGSAVSIPERAQFNAQISIVVPTGESIVITNKYMPLQSNQSYSGTAPMDWTLGNPIFSPLAQPENDFYSVFPKLSPASFYNDLHQGDEVTLFSFIAGTTGQYDENVRFFQNGVDPSDQDAGMGGGDFSNGFTLGSPVNIYDSNSAESCITDVIDAEEINANVFPNPFQHQLSIDLISENNKVQVLDTNGKVYYTSQNKSKGILVINTYDYAAGVYYVKIETENGIATKKVIKI